MPLFLDNLKFKNILNWSNKLILYSCNVLCACCVCSYISVLLTFMMAQIIKWIHELFTEDNTALYTSYSAEGSTKTYLPPKIAMSQLKDNTCFLSDKVLAL